MWTQPCVMTCLAEPGIDLYESGVAGKIGKSTQSNRVFKPNNAMIYVLKT